MPKRNRADGGMSHEPSGGRGVTKDMAVAVLADYVCSNPLQDENETHERMFLYDENETHQATTLRHERMFLRADMGRCRVQHESLCGCFYQNLDQRDPYLLLLPLTSHGS